MVAKINSPKARKPWEMAEKRFESGLEHYGRLYRRKEKSPKFAEQISARMKRILEENTLLETILSLRRNEETPTSILKKFYFLNAVARFTILLALEKRGYSVRTKEGYIIDEKDPKTRKTFLAGMRALFGEIDQLK